MKKKYLIVLLALIGMIACAVGLSACGSGESGGTTGGTTGGVTDGGESGNGTQTEKTAGTAGLEYTLSAGGAYYICSGIGTCSETEIEIASWYEDKWVTEIGDSAFSGCTGLRSVTIPDSVTEIDQLAFSGCTGLTSVTIPDSVTEISNSAFDGCTGLNYNQYENAYYLGNKNNPYVVLVKATSTDITSCTIHSETKLIHFSAFKDCTGLTSVTIGNSVTSIGNYAFSHCTGLTSVTIPDSVTSIGNYAFLDCTNLNYNQYDNAYYLGNENDPYVALISAKDTAITSCKVHNNTKAIAGMAFYHCTGLTSVTIGNGVTSIGEYAFYNCTGLTSVTIGNSVTSIGNYAFSHCTGLTSVTIPDSVTKIGACAFYGCTGLTSVTIPDSVTSINYQAFFGCSNLTSITIPNSVTSIGSSAFTGCTGLTSITIPDSVTFIGGWVFLGCTGLTGVYITNIAAWCRISFNSDYSNPLTYAGNLYLNGTLVTELVIPDSVTSIGDYTFDGCTSLTSISIPDNVTSIGGFAFRGCTGLTSIVIPDSVTSIGKWAFVGCTSLMSISIPDSVTFIGDYAFGNCTGLNYNQYDNAYYLGNENNPYVVLVKATSTDITNCTIHSDTKIIYYSAFYECSNLTSVVFKNTNGWWVFGSITVTATSGTSISSDDLADPATAATYLSSTYRNCYWKRN